jgi:4-hydroxy-tetrahydrodipicolinate synthase
MITGSLVAIVTPMQEDGRLDHAAFKKLIDWHVAEGTDGIVVVGTTGESPTVSFEEHKDLIRLAVQHARGRIPIIAGTGGNSTAEAVELTESAKKAGATACLSVVPYYNKPTQEGLYRHFRKVAEAVDLPIVVYNIPGRTGTNILPETMARLASIDTVVAVKESTGSLQQVQEMIKLCGEKFTVLSGDDWATLPLLSVNAMRFVPPASACM